MGKKKEDNKENLIKKYVRIRDTIIEICADYNFDCEDYLKRFPTDDYEKLTGCQISHRISELNADLRVLIGGLFLEDWTQTIHECYDNKEQKSVFAMVETLMRGDPADAHKYLTKTMKLLKMLNNPETNQEALQVLEEYCSTHSFEDAVNTYSLATSSKFGREVHETMGVGLGKQKVPKRVKIGMEAYFFAPSKTCEKKKEEPDPQPGNN